MKGNLAQVYSWPDFCEASLRRYYVALRSAMPLGAFASRERALIRVQECLGLTAGQTNLVLAIFAQLNLIRYDRQPPYLTMEPVRKVQLMDSTIYRLSNHYFRQGGERDELQG
jgi:hypothetical protein